MSILYSILSTVSISKISIMLQSAPFMYTIIVALFCCICLLIYVFSRYMIFSFRLLIAWIISCLVTLLLLAMDNVDTKALSISINSQIILSFASCVIILILYIISIISNKPKKRKKRYNKVNLSTRILGSDVWWAKTIGFIALVAFCCVFNIGLFVSCSLLYL
ncbi:Uncharacterised protein [Helicobacter muridarum]|uniref:Uncharacterized protein n=1 Tax=Helicobacter muridarum TaxID=216 RepID=A0A099TVK0_9HELI|nr:Uncharacterised protein [Helicobacter muridarum]